MKPLLVRLHPYPFERLRRLVADTDPPALPPIRLSIGLAREAHRVNPGSGCVRIALAPDTADCVEAARSIVECCR